MFCNIACALNTPFADKVGDIKFNTFQENPSVVLNKDKIEWPNGKTPLDSPPCDFDGEKCMTSSTSGALTQNGNANIGKFEIL